LIEFAREIRYVQISRFKVQGSRFKVQGSRFKVQGLLFKLPESRINSTRCRFIMLIK
jgi:hypothetical protein